MSSWWHEPASISGKHHPPGQTNLGHALGVYRACRWMWRRVPWDDLRPRWDLRADLLWAALYHDWGKTIDRANHELAGANWALERWPARPLRAWFILRHSGRWGPDYSQCVRWLIDHQQARLDTGRVQWLGEVLQAADYTDAHRHLIWSTRSP